MRELPFDTSNATTLARVFVLELADGARFGFTDCDVALGFDGLTCKPVDATDSEGRTGFDADSGALRTVFDIDLSQDAIADGALDGASLTEYRVDVTDPAKAVLIAKGRIGDVSLTAQGFEADWLGQATLLDRSTGRLFSRLCDAEYGDTRCGLAAQPGRSCARTLEACRGFDNVVNFRGFPYILGDDVLQAGVHVGPSRDGGSRYGR